MKPIVFHPDVEKDIESAFEWYEGKSEGLGIRFVSELEKAFDAIRYAPSSWTLFRYGFRRYTVSHFPFSVIYKETNEKVYVIAVMHHRQSPNHWGKRV